MTMPQRRRDLWDNPLGTDGFEFVEFTAPDAKALDELFSKLGFSLVARHRSKAVTLYRQGGINFILNAESSGFPARFATEHGPSINAFAIRVNDTRRALAHAARMGAGIRKGGAGPMELNIPAIEGVGGSLLYLVDRFGAFGIYDVDFEFVEGAARQPQGLGLTHIDHLTHNVQRGHMDEWAEFYERIFNFRQIRHFDIKGRVTGLKSRAMTSPCGRIRIPINEEASKNSTGQIAEFLDQYKGDGVQHVALAATDLAASLAAMRDNGMRFLDTPDSYYEGIDERLPGHGLDVELLKRNRILVDGAPQAGEGLLLQIFTECVIGPIFIELIERRGNEGFGEGNFQALFEAIELDQIRRGIVSES